LDLIILSPFSGVEAKLIKLLIFNDSLLHEDIQIQTISVHYKNLNNES